MIFSIWPGGANFLPDSPVVDDAALVFLKAHSGTGIFPMGTDF